MKKQIREFMDDMGMDVKDVIEGIVGWGSLLILVFMASVVF